MLLELEDSEDDVIFQKRCDGYRYDFSIRTDLERDVGKIYNIGSFFEETDDKAWLR